MNSAHKVVSFITSVYIKIVWEFCLISHCIPRSQQKYALLHLLNEERNTWNLVRSLFKDQIETEQKEALDEDMAIDQVSYRAGIFA